MDKSRTFNVLTILFYQNVDRYYILDILAVFFFNLFLRNILIILLELVCKFPHLA